MKQKLPAVAKFIVFGLTGLILCFSTQRAVAGCTLTAKITSHTNVKCYGDSTGSAVVTPSGGIAPYKYVWSPLGGTKDTANGLHAGLYIVTVTDSVGCIAKDTINILQPDSQLVVSIVPTAATCGKNNGSATANTAGGVKPYKYAWSPSGGSNATANNLAPGTYTCVVTDSNNCTIINSTIITGTGGPAINVTQTPDSGTCSGTVTAN